MSATHGRRPITRHIGQRFGRLVVQTIIASRPKAQARVICDCGEVLVVRMGNVANGRTTSCGCASRELSSQRARTHGATLTPEHRVWRNMRQRCGHHADPSFADYGGRGIAVCERWQIFENFLADMGNRPSASHSLDRIDNNAGYSPENCRWATQSEQMRNTRRTVFIEVNGARVPAISVYEKHGISSGVFFDRVKRGWDPLRAATTPHRRAVSA